MADEIKDLEIEVVESSEVEVWRPGKLPISFLQCSRCYLNRQCPLYDEGAEICPLESLEPIDTTTGEGIIGVIQTILGVQAKRVLRMVKFEEAEGGIADPNVTREMQTFVELVERLKRILSDDDMLVIKAKGKAASGIMSKLLGDIKDE